MLRSVRQLYRHKLGASDGDIGHVQDFYFDDRNWVVRYMVADTGSWLSGRKVLIAPHAFKSLDRVGHLVRVNLTRDQIEHSPSIETHKPVSRQYEEEYYRHFGWPFYWQGDGLWGMSGLPTMGPPAEHPPSMLGLASGPLPEGPDAHLRSMQAVNGYSIKVGDETLGHICDFMMDDQSWAIGELVMKSGHRFSGAETSLLTSNVDRISYEISTVFMRGTKEVVEQVSAPPVPPASASR